MRWFAFLPLALAFDLLARVVAPVLPLFAVKREGWCDNGSRWLSEPRLPAWLAWFDTPDNSLWGDSGWRTIHCPNHFDAYLGMVLWLWRNSACGFARSVMARTVQLADVTYTGNPRTSHAGPYGLFRARAKGAWQFKWAAPVPGTGWVVQLNLGWQINSMVESGQPVDLCHYKMSPKIKRRT
jgi:hypothetical protein